VSSAAKSVAWSSRTFSVGKPSCSPWSLAESVAGAGARTQVQRLPAGIATSCAAPSSKATVSVEARSASGSTCSHASTRSGVVSAKGSMARPERSADAPSVRPAGRTRQVWPSAVGSWRRTVGSFTRVARSGSRTIPSTRLGSRSRSMPTSPRPPSRRRTTSSVLRPAGSGSVVSSGPRALSSPSTTAAPFTRIERRAEASTRRRMLRGSRSATSVRSVISRPGRTASRSWAPEVELAAAERSLHARRPIAEPRIIRAREA
jgi:hypothetical protein